jgi:hypothetical protein
MDIKDDKSLWEPMYLEGVGKVLLVEESYYNLIIEHIGSLKKEIAELIKENKKLKAQNNLHKPDDKQAIVVDNYNYGTYNYGNYNYGNYPSK